MPEEVIGIMEKVISFGADVYNLVFTTERIIVAKAENLKGMLKLVGTAMLGGKYNSGRIFDKEREKNLDNAVERIKNSDPETILSSDKHNFSIEYNKIERVEMKLGNITFNTRIEIFTNDGKDYKYFIKNRGPNGEDLSQEVFDEYVSMIKTVIPDKLFIK